MLGLLITMWFINIPYECNQLLQNSCLGKKIKKTRTFRNVYSKKRFATNILRNPSNAETL